MIKDFPKIPLTPGDVVVSVFGTFLGLIIGLILLSYYDLPDHIGVYEVATLGFLFSLGLKRSIHIIHGWVKSNENKKNESLLKRSNTLILFCEGDIANTFSKKHFFTDNLERFKRSIELWQGGVLTDQDFESKLILFENLVINASNLSIKQPLDSKKELSD